MTVVERERIGAGSSSVAAGMLAPAGEAQWGQGPLARACAASAALWPEFAADLEQAAGSTVGYRRAGALHVALDRDEAAELKRRLPLVADLDPKTEWCLPSRCRELEPGLSSSAGPGFLVPGEAVVDSRRLLAALTDAVRGGGAALIEGDEPTEPLVEDGRCSGVVLRCGGSLEAGAVLVATGAWAGTHSWLPAEQRPAVRPVKGEILRLRAVEPIAERIIHTERVYLAPHADGEISVGASSEEKGFETSVNAGAVHELLREAYRVLPEIAECEFVAAEAGLRPASADGAPLLGRTSLEGLHLACGHYRNGILLAPLSAEVVLAGLTGAEPPLAAREIADPDRAAEARR